MNKVLRFQNTLQALECYSLTSSRVRVLVVQVSIAAYLTRFAINFFPTIRSMQENKEITADKLRRRTTFQLWFTSSGFHKWSVLFEVLAPMSLFLWGSHMQKQYHKRIIFHSKSSTIKGLLYAPDPDKREKGTLSDQPQLLPVTSTALLCCWGRSPSKIWHSLGLTLRRMPYGRGTLRIPLRSIL